MSQEQLHPSQATSPPHTAPDRNTKPLLKAAGLFLSLLIVGLVAGVTLVPDRQGALAAIGTRLFDLFIGCVALGIWARQSLTRWTAFGWLWRSVLCLVLSILAMDFIALSGDAARVPK